MKNKKLVGLLALASCVVLSACGSDQAPEVSLVLRTLPTELILGEELDLSTYVGLENAAGFDVQLDDASKAIASVDGGKVTATAEGEVKFTVTAGGKTVEGSIAAIAKERKLLREKVKDVEYDYTFLGFNSAGNVDSIVAHDKDYVFTTSFFGQGIGGFVKTVSDLYWQFSCTGIDGTGLAVNPSAITKSTFDYYNLPLTDLDVSALEFKTETVDDGQGGQEVENWLCWEEDEKGTVAKFAAGTLLDSYVSSILVKELDIYVEEWSEVVEGETLTGIDYVFALVCDVPEYFFDQTWDGQTIPETFEYQTAALDVAYLYTGTPSTTLGQGVYKVAGLEAYIESGVEPVSKDKTPIVNAFKALQTAKNYTINMNYGWFAGADSDTAIACPSAKGYFPYYCFTGTETTKVTENQTLQIVGGNEKTATGLLIDNNVLYSYSYLTVVDDKVDADGLYATEEGEDLKIFGRQASIGYSFEFVAYDSMFTNIFVATSVRDDDTNSTKYTWNANTTRSLFLNLSSCSGGNYMIASAINQVASWSTFVEYFEATCTIFDNGTIDLLFVLVLELDSTVFCYKFDIEFTDIGTTTIDALTINMPQAE